MRQLLCEEILKTRSILIIIPAIGIKRFEPPKQLAMFKNIMIVPRRVASFLFDLKQTAIL